MSCSVYDGKITHLHPFLLKCLESVLLKHATKGNGPQIMIKLSLNSIYQLLEIVRCFLSDSHDLLGTKIASGR